jgi:heterotetrameric sarcosine oxidase delta subunit
MQTPVVSDKPANVANSSLPRFKLLTMSFQLTCPNCGKRSVNEFTFKSEYLQRPDAEASFAEWADYVYLRQNRKGKQVEWWYHRTGCQSWFLVERDTTNNVDHRSFWLKDWDGSVRPGNGNE